MPKATFKMDTGQFSKLQAQLHKTAEERVKKGRQTLTSIAKEILDESLKEVPRESGTLASTGFVERSGSKVVVGYGSSHDKYNKHSHADASEYMVKQHEDLFQAHPNGGKAKFLEDPVNRAADQMEEKLFESMRG